MQVKKTRAEAYKPSGGTSSSSSHSSSNRPSTPVDTITKRSSSKTKVKFKGVRMQWWRGKNIFGIFRLPVVLEGTQP